MDQGLLKQWTAFAATRTAAFAGMNAPIATGARYMRCLQSADGNDNQSILF